MRVLLVDDDPALRVALTKALARKGIDVIDLASGEAAIEPLKSGVSSAGPVDVCLLDLRMPGMSGIEVLRRTPHRKVPVIVLSGHGTVPDAVEAMRLGAMNFVQKPIDADEIVPVLHQATRAQAQPEVTTLLGASDIMLAFLEKLDRAAQSDEPVLLVGETGTGKELCARRIHEGSKHKRAPFVAFNSASLPKEVFDSELFGHRRGAFQGAHDTRDGLMAKAADGTLFIDEVGDMPAEAQGKVLRAIEERCFRPVGADSERQFRARVVAASRTDLKAQVERGAFRADLFYRLSVIVLQVPPLRERGDDVVLIARACLGRASEGRRTLCAAAEDRLRRYRFPGNVREMVNLMKRAALFASADVVDLELVDELLAESPYREGHGNKDDSAPRAGQRVTLEELERTHIKRLLDELRNVSEVARIVGIDRRTLQRKMAAWGLRDELTAP